MEKKDHDIFSYLFILIIIIIYNELLKAIIFNEQQKKGLIKQLISFLSRQTRMLRSLP